MQLMLGSWRAVVGLVKIRGKGQGLTIWRARLCVVTNQLWTRGFKSKKIAPGVPTFLVDFRWIRYISTLGNMMSGPHGNFTLTDLVNGPSVISHLCRLFRQEFCAKITVYTGPRCRKWIMYCTITTNSPEPSHSSGRNIRRGRGWWQE